MDNDQLLEQFEELYKKYTDFEHRQLDRSAMKGAIEAKRFAKLHRLLTPYLRTCLSITDNAQTIFEAEIGTDNAMEIIALVESEEKARKFQQDFDIERDQYTSCYICACAYHSLATHTAMRCGYNSKAVHGAIDDGIHVCRRMGMLECIDYFRDFAFETSAL